MKNAFRSAGFARKVNCGIVTAALLAAGAVYGQEAASTTPSPYSKGAGASALEHNPTAFIKEAAEGNDAEIALAEVAQRKAQNSEVKQLATQIRSDHQQANQQLKPIAQAHSIVLDQPISAKHEAKLQKMQQLSGADFDRAYVSDMLQDHHKDMAKYQQAAQEIQETDVKNYAEQTLPALHRHFQLAESAARAIGMSDATISQILKQKPEAVGGTMEKNESQSGTIKNSGQ